MVNHPNRSKRTVRFTNTERRALKIAIGFIMAGEWDETLSQAEADALETARDKIDQDARNAIANLPTKPGAK